MSAVSAEFRDLVGSWLEADAELLLLVRLHAAAGTKRWYLLRSIDDLDVAVGRANPTDCLTVFSGSHLPLRGRADEPGLVDAARDLCRRSPDFLVGEVRSGDPELIHAEDFATEDDVQLRGWFQDFPHVAVACGPWPPFESTDPAVAVDALVPHADGSLSFDGAY